MSKSSKFSDILFSPFVVGLIVYFTVRYLFPEKQISNLESEIKKDLDLSDDTTNINFQKKIGEVRGGNLVRNNFVREVLKKSREFIKGKSLKAALISVFAAAAAGYFTDEVRALLLDNMLHKLRSQNLAGKLKGNLKIIVDIITENEIDLHPAIIKELIIDTKLSRFDKLTLLKVKLEYILSEDCTGKRRFIVVTFLAIIATIFLSGTAGLGLFLEALYELFKEGKLSKAIYNQLKEVIKSALNNSNMPMPNLPFDDSL